MKSRVPSAAEWLRKNDPDYRKEKRRASARKRRDKRQAEANPALVARYQRMMRVAPRR